MGGISRAITFAAALCATIAFDVASVDAGGAVTTSLFLPLTGNPLIFPPSPCASSGDTVPITGNVHVVSIVPPTPIVPPSPIRLHFNLADVMGTGTMSGNIYIGTGVQDVTVPPTPVIPVQATFTLQHTDGCADTPLPVFFILNFDASGHLLQDGSSASLGQCNFDNPSLCNGTGG